MHSMAVSLEVLTKKVFWLFAFLALVGSLWAFHAGCRPPSPNTASGSVCTVTRWLVHGGFLLGLISLLILGVLAEATTPLDNMGKV